MELILILMIIHSVITLMLWMKFKKLNERLSSLEKRDFSDNIKELKNIKHETIQEANEITSTAKDDIKAIVSDYSLMVENGPLSEKVERIETEIYEAHDRLFKLITDIYDDSVTSKALLYSREYIDDEIASDIKLTYAGKVDMINWLKPAKRGAIYEDNLHMFYKYYKDYAKNKSYYKTDEASFIDFMNMYIPALKTNLKYSRELEKMSHDEIWVKLAELGTKYNR